MSYLVVVPCHRLVDRATLSCVLFEQQLLQDTSNWSIPDPSPAAASAPTASVEVSSRQAKTDQAACVRVSTLR